MAAMRTAREALVGVALAATLVAGACSSGSTSTSSGAPPSTGAPATGGASGGSTGSGGGTTPGSATSSAGGAPSKFAGFSDTTYAQGQNWLCGPGIATDDRCLRADLDRTVVKADGTTEQKTSPAATNPPFDCFYVYPTVNFTGGGNDETMASDTGPEDAVTRAQAARYREVCRVYAPLYRQSTIGGYANQDREKIQAIAYGDVLNAFKQYMANWNQGRPVLLVGHSQGSGHLMKLLQEQYDNDPTLRSKLVAAHLIGGFTTTNPGQPTGGSFQNIPTCTKPDEAGCVVGFNTVATDTPAGDLQRWGSAPDGKQRMCTNPGSLAAGPAPVDPIVANSNPSYTTPWVEYPGALTAECRTADGFTTLLVTATPGDSRNLADKIGNVPGWGLHINEFNLVHGDLIELARTQSAALR
jgi:hypothetical protein